MMVSVIIPTIPERKQMLDRALLSLRNQTYKDLEILVMDGPGSAPMKRQEGIKKAKGEYIAFLDDDDYWTDFDKIQRQLEVFKRDRHIVLVGCGYFDEACGEDRYPTCRGYINDRLLLSFCNIETSTVMMEADLAKRLGIDLLFESEQNHDFFLRLTNYGRFEYVPEVMVFKAREEGEQISRNAGKKIRGFIRFHAKHRWQIWRLPWCQRMLVLVKFPCVLCLFVASYLCGTDVRVPKKIDEFLKKRGEYA